MEVQVNGKPVEVTENSTLSSLLGQLNLPEKGVAVACNSKMIQRSEWVNTKLNAGDKVLVIKAACGG